MIILRALFLFVQFLCSRLPAVAGKSVLDANSGSGGLVFEISQLVSQRYFYYIFIYSCAYLYFEDIACILKHKFRFKLIQFFYMFCYQLRKNDIERCRQFLSAYSIFWWNCVSNKAKRFILRHM